MEKLRNIIYTYLSKSVSKPEGNWNEQNERQKITKSIYLPLLTLTTPIHRHTHIHN